MISSIKPRNPSRQRRAFIYRFTSPLAGSRAAKRPGGGSATLEWCVAPSMQWYSSFMATHVRKNITLPALLIIGSGRLRASEHSQSGLIVQLVRWSAAEASQVDPCVSFVGVIRTPATFLKRSTRRCTAAELARRHRPFDCALTRDRTIAGGNVIATQRKRGRQSWSGGRRAAYTKLQIRPPCQCLTNARPALTVSVCSPLTQNSSK